MHVRLIALDLDGTLLTSRKAISPRTRQALRAARERGIALVIASGRTLQSSVAFSRELGGGPVICCNGAGILDESGQLVVARALPVSPLRRVLELGNELKVLTECYTPEGIVLDRPREQLRTYLQWVKPQQSAGQAWTSLIRLWRLNRIRPVRNLLRWIEQPTRPAVLKVMLVGDPERLHRLGQTLGREVPGLSVTTSGKDNLEVIAAGVNKGTALQALSGRLQIPRDSIIAMGDSDNDLEMLEYAGLGVAMGNACESVKQAADHVTTTCDDDGVAQVIEQYCLR